MICFHGKYSGSPTIEWVYILFMQIKMDSFINGKYNSLAKASFDWQ
jgi:hypothetical protein